MRNIFLIIIFITTQSIFAASYNKHSASKLYKEAVEQVKKEQNELRVQQNRFRGTNIRDGRNENFGNTTSGGKWYFYNPATLSFGMSEFRKKWGNKIKLFYPSF